MTTAYTSLLGLALPVTGELSGTWGDTVNNYITQYTDAAVAGTQTISGTQTAVTLSITNGGSLSQAGSGTTGSAQYQVINCTGAPASLLTITAPASSKTYVIVNTTSTSQSVKIVGVGPTTGVTIVSGEKAIVAWNGSDFVKVSSSLVSQLSGTLAVANGGTGLTTTPSNGQIDIGNGTGFTRAALTAGSGVSITNGAGSITIAATGSGGTVTSVGMTVPAFLSVTGSPITGSGTLAVSYSGTALPVANGGTGATSLTANNVLLGNGTSALQVVAPGTSGNVLTSNGTTWVSTTPSAGAAATPTSLGSVYGKTSSSDFNQFFGYSAGSAVTSGASNSFFGHSTGLYITTGTGNTAMGAIALYGANTSSASNTAIGPLALYGNGAQTVFNYTVAVGYSAGYSNAASDNTFLGTNAGYGVTSGAQNVIIGSGAANTGTILTTGSNNILVGYQATPSSATISNEVTIGNTSITSTRLRGMVQLNAAMFEQGTVSATAATGTINFDTLTQSVLYYTTNASGNWTLNIRGNSGTSLNSIMATGQSLTIAFLATQGSTAYYQTALNVDGSAVTPKWQGGTAPTSGNASSTDIYVITLIKTASATFTALASQTKFA